MRLYLMFMTMFLAIFLFSACNVSHGNQKIFNEVYANRAMIGSTVVELIELFGQPSTVSTVKSKKGGEADSKTYIWNATKAKTGLLKGKAKTVSIICTVHDGKVTDIQKLNSDSGN